MLDFITYQAAQERTSGHAGEARPNNPVRPDHQRTTIRHRISVTLHRLADRLEPSDPAREHRSPVTAAMRC